MEDENQRPPAWVPMYISDWFVAASAMQADEFRDVVLKLCTYAITDERPVFKNRFAKLLLDRFEVEIPKSKARSAQAVAAARAKWEKSNKIKDGAMPEHMPEHMQMDMQPTPTPTPTITNTAEKVSCAFSDETAPAIARQVYHEKPAKQNDTIRGSRLPDDWYPDTALMAYADQHGLTPEETATEVERFRNYWHAQPGAKGRKVKWDATWKNWILKAKEGNRNVQQSRQNGNRSAEMPVEERRAMVARVVMQAFAEKGKPAGANGHPGGGF